MRYPEQEDPHSELTKRIIGCAQAVHSELRNGLNKKIYENSLCVEFTHQQIDFSQQSSFIVNYRNRPVGKLIPDLIIDNKVIVETKVVEGFAADHIAQSEISVISG